jgi:F-type H+-transporting ATPase subunit b
MSTTNLAAGDNFLLPNATFFVELIIFLVVLWIFWKFIVPPIRKAMRERNELVQQGFEEARQAEEKFHEAEKRYQQALGEARSEAAKIRDTARAEGQQILDEFRSRTSAEVAGLRQTAAEQLAAERERVVAEVRPQVDELAEGLASRVVGEDIRRGR